MEDAEGPIQEQESTELLHLVELPFLTNHDKQGIFLTASGKKPAGFVNLYYLPEDPRYDVLTSIDTLSDVLSKFSVPYKVLPAQEVIDEEEVSIRCVLFGRDEKQLQLLDEAYASDDLIATYNLGISLGYPESAVEAFLNGNTLTSSEVREDSRFDGIIPFLLFAPSRDHTEEEIEQVKKQRDFIKMNAPALYKHILESKKV